MKLAAMFKNDSNGGLSDQLKQFLENNVADLNILAVSFDGPIAIVVREDGNSVFPAPELCNNLPSFGITEEELYVAALKPPEEHFMRLIYDTALGKGCCDVLVDETVE
jgi:hypothetical protein